MTRKSIGRAPAEQRPERVVQQDEQRRRGRTVRIVALQFTGALRGRVATRPRRVVSAGRGVAGGRARDRRRAPGPTLRDGIGDRGGVTSSRVRNARTARVDRRATGGRFAPRGCRARQRVAGRDDPLRRRVGADRDAAHTSVESRRRALRRQHHDRADRRAGLTAGRTRYVRAQPSAVLDLAEHRPDRDAARDTTPPSPELYDHGARLERASERDAAQLQQVALRAGRRCSRVRSARCGWTIPNALPSADIALDRGIRDASRGSRCSSSDRPSAPSPTSPSGATTRLRRATPAREPARQRDRVVLDATPRPLQRLGGDESPLAVARRGRAARAAARSPTRASRRVRAASASAVAASSSRSSRRGTRRASARPAPAGDTSGATTVRRSAPATGSRRFERQHQSRRAPAAMQAAEEDECRRGCRTARARATGSLRC